MDFHIVKMHKDKVSTKMSKIFVLSMCDVKVFLTFGADLTTVLLVLFKYCCKYCKSVIVFCYADYTSRIYDGWHGIDLSGNRNEHHTTQIVNWKYSHANCPKYIYIYIYIYALE
jgi:hypothetical protein